MKNLSILLFAIVTTLGSCKKNVNDANRNKDAVNTTRLGNIEGVLSPAKAGKAVVASATVDGKLLTYSVKPDNNGGFVFSALPVAEYIISFSAAAGFSNPGNKIISVNADQTSDAGTTKFIEAASGGISGRILPAGAVLKISIRTLIGGEILEYTALTDHAGAFSFSNLPPSSYVMIFTPGSDYLPSGDILQVKVVANQSADMGTITFLAKTSGAISGVISPAGAVSAVRTTSIINGQNVDYKATVNQDGSFKFTNLTAGAYVLRYAIAGNYEMPEFPACKVVAGELTNLGTLVFPISKTTGAIIGSVDRPSVLTGIVAAKMDNIFLRYYGYLDDETGNFLINKLPPGNYLINYITKSSANYYAPGTSDIAVAAGQSTNVGLKSIWDAALGSISGKIYPEGSVSTVSAVSDATGKVFKAIPDAVGNFTLPGLVYGKYFVSALPEPNSSLFSPYHKPISLGNGEILNIGTIMLTTYAAPYPVMFEANGVKYQTESGIFDTYYTKSTFGINSQVNRHRLIIMLKGVTGVGEYLCKGSTGSTMSFSEIKAPPRPDEMMSFGGNWSTSYNGSEALVKITEIDHIGKMISGTFAAKLMFGLSVKTITNGTFHVPFQ